MCLKKNIISRICKITFLAKKKTKKNSAAAGRFKREKGGYVITTPCSALSVAAAANRERESRREREQSKDQVKVYCT